MTLAIPSRVLKSVRKLANKLQYENEFYMIYDFLKTTYRNSMGQDLETLDIHVTSNPMRNDQQLMIHKPRNNIFENHQRLYYQGCANHNANCLCFHVCDRFCDVQDYTNIIWLHNCFVDANLSTLQRSGLVSNLYREFDRAASSVNTRLLLAHNFTACTGVLVVNKGELVTPTYIYDYYILSSERTRNFDLLEKSICIADSTSTE